jgi:benzoyl-CoA reductase/2-hydroxyglutaryl-CoA dehydratase subunit BcrC/BadD/HgdB
MMNPRPRLGFACAYTPLPLIDAAGFVPYRVLPMGEAPDQAGTLLHDNMCPHVKRILDRALAADLPELAGVIFMASCDAMRRLYDAWKVARPGDRVELVDLPVGDDEIAVSRFAQELHRLVGVLESWAETMVSDAALASSCSRYAELASGLERVAERAARGTLEGGGAEIQRLVNLAVSRSLDEALIEVADALAASEGERSGGGVPVMVFGNVLPDPDALALFESCGARLVDEDLCTGAKQVLGVEVPAGKDPFHALARALLRRPPCARTIRAGQPARLGAELVERARQAGARGVIVHVAKFCDPYLTRLPALHAELRRAELPALVLEGDCSMRSLGQQRTRIEAFVEMLGG